MIISKKKINKVFFPSRKKPIKKIYIFFYFGKIKKKEKKINKQQILFLDSNPPIMGNKALSKIDIDDIIDKPIVEEPDNVYYIKFEVDGKENSILIMGDGAYFNPTWKLGENVINYKWDVKTHARDFEVINPFEKNEIHIARGQAVGVIIVEPLKSYFKIIRETKNKSGFHLPQYGPWDHSPICQQALHSDLSLGITHVLLITAKATFASLCEEIDERDKKETTIIFPHLQKLASYKKEEEEKEKEKN